jgi:hypothetical protein
MINTAPCSHLISPETMYDNEANSVPAGMSGARMFGEEAGSVERRRADWEVPFPARGPVAIDWRSRRASWVAPTGSPAREQAPRDLCNFFRSAEWLKSRNYI